MWDANDPCQVVSPDRVHWAVPALGIGRNSFIFKLQPVPSKLKARLQDEPRIDTSHPRRWFPFELTGESDLRAALERLHVAYENAPELVFARKKRLRKLPDSHGG